MVLEPEPVLVTDPTLTEVLDELRAREPLIDPQVTIVGMSADGLNGVRWSFDS